MFRSLVIWGRLGFLIRVCCSVLRSKQRYDPFSAQKSLIGRMGVIQERVVVNENLRYLPDNLHPTS